MVKRGQVSIGMRLITIIISLTNLIIYNGAVILLAVYFHGPLGIVSCMFKNDFYRDAAVQDHQMCIHITKLYI